jgi:hypothetical protein
MIAGLQPSADWSGEWDGTPLMGSGFRIRSLSFHGPNREPALLEFGRGLNVIYGASDTGKSFVVEVIDFMLGGRAPLRDIPERVGYDRVLMGIQTILGGMRYTFSRSADGGRFKVYPGLHTEPPREDIEGHELGDQHSDRNVDNLSFFLLMLCGLAGRRIRRNKRGDTNSLSFRNIARLLIVTETEITADRSPLSDGNPTADTPNFATFKLLLTGVDDSALVGGSARTPEEQSREAQLELLDQLIDDYRCRLKEFTKEPSTLREQSERLEQALQRDFNQLRTTEAEYRDIVGKRRDLRERLEQGLDRRGEIAGLLERFALLEQHYNSDIKRLRGIEEAGTLFDVLGQTSCPLCGADPEHHRADEACDGDVAAVVAAARSEIAKIELLKLELGETQKELKQEAVSFDRRLPKVEEELREIAERVEKVISPGLARMRGGYTELVDKRSEVRQAEALYQSLQDMERRRGTLSNGALEQQVQSVANGDVPSETSYKFALTVERILHAWHFPNAERVSFDAKSRDLIIAGKHRIARGKGLRAITHAAFTIGLLEYCREQDTPHPGFVILDSPLLAYRAPEGAEDDLRGTDLNERFYEYLARTPDDRQVIIVENSNPPAAIVARQLSQMFTSSPHQGRYGYFPIGRRKFT